MQSMDNHKFFFPYPQGGCPTFNVVGLTNKMTEFRLLLSPFYAVFFKYLQFLVLVLFPCP